MACEESQSVCIEFRKLGFEAYSCDIEPSTGGHPEWHLQQDVTELLKEKWDLIIAFPPCTHLAVSGSRHFKKKQEDGRQQQAIDFFNLFTKIECPFAIENPVGIMSTHYRKPDQIIQPWQFGDLFEKKTCLWLNKLPKLNHTNIVTPPPRVSFKTGNTTMASWCNDAWKLPPKERSKVRSKTFPGIALAMAQQWSVILKHNYIPENNNSLLDFVNF